MAKKNKSNREVMAAIDEAADAANAAAAPAALEGQAKACPTFVLRADRPGHVRALRAAIEELGPPDSIEARAALEAFKRFGR